MVTGKRWRFRVLWRSYDDAEPLVDPGRLTLVMVPRLSELCRGLCPALWALAAALPGAVRAQRAPVEADGWPARTSAFTSARDSAPAAASAMIPPGTTVLGGDAVFRTALYVNQSIGRNRQRLDSLLQQATAAGFTALILDVQPDAISAATVARVRAQGLVPVARVEVFAGGLRSITPDPAHVQQLAARIQASCLVGFAEINLDYIRYADGPLDTALTNVARSRRIAAVITDLRQRTRDACAAVPFTADVFGRIPFLRDDNIGQGIESFDAVVDGIYPMLYPSHFYSNAGVVAQPYPTVFHGVRRTVQRVKRARPYAWIQGFAMSVARTGLSRPDYILAQMRAAYDACARGFAVWHQAGQYDPTFAAFARFRQQLSAPGARRAGCPVS